MRSLNQVQLIGNLTRDPEVKYIPSGDPVANFSIATNREWTDSNGEKQEAADFHNVVAWRKLAEVCGQYLKKGNKVYISGRLQTRSWEKDGVKRYATEVVCKDVIFLTPKGAQEVSKPDGESTAGPVKGESQTGGNEPDGSEDVDPNEVPSDLSAANKDMPF